MKINKWTSKEIELLIANYGKITLKEIANNLIKRSVYAISFKAYKLGLTDSKLSRKNGPKYSFNQNFFSIPNIENCYWAGFIAADGCIRYNKKTQKSGSLRIVLHGKDNIIIETFHKTIKYTGPIRYFSIDKRPRVDIQLYNMNNWGPDLKNNFNIIPNKTFLLIPPNLKDLKLQLAYIIGYIDGDGAISIIQPKRYKSKHLLLQIAGTKLMMKWISNILYKLENKNKYILRRIIPIKSIFKISYDYNRAKDLLILLNKISIPFKLPRKWNKINELYGSNI